MLDAEERVLGIDAASVSGSVALARPAGILKEVALAERGAHAHDLLGRIDDLLEHAGLRPDDLRGIAATLGPGSFTGVRVGLATGKGLAYALGIPLVGLSTLDALARATVVQGGEAAISLWAVVDAGRGEVYAALFRITDGEPVRETADRSVRPEDLVPSLSPGARIVGDAAEKVGRIATEAGKPMVVIAPCPLLAGPLALWGSRTLAPGASYEPGGPRPNYVRPSDAVARHR
jgi:tRNA threonylcarbamoyladenosine biosynthesis protein TsaB